MRHEAGQIPSWLIFDVGRIMHAKLAVILLSFTSAVLAAAEVEFVGYFRIGAEVRFVVALPEGKTTSGWLAVGDMFQEFTIKAFEEKDGALQLSGPEVL